MPILFAPIRINNTYYVDGGILMNLPVSPIRKECEKVIALNVDPLVADEYSKNVVSIALRAYHFIFQANTLPQKGIADLLIESYGLEEYSNRELEEPKRYSKKDTIRQRNSWTDYSWRMERFGDKQKKNKMDTQEKLLSIRYSPVYSGTTACVVSLMVLWRKTVAEKMADFTTKALSEIKTLGATHIWYTGIIEHATQTNYTRYGIKPDHPAVVKRKGRITVCHQGLL